MRNVTLAARLALGVVGTAAGALGGSALRSALAGDPVTSPLGYGAACWTSPVLCRTNYAARSPYAGVPGGFLPVKDIVQFSTGHVWAIQDEILDAEGGWNNVPGPQHLSQAPQPNDTWNYLHDTVDPEGILTNPAYGVGYGITYLCNDSYLPACSPRPRPIDIQYANVYFYWPNYSGLDHYHRITAVAHELGHTLGLGHHAAPDALMYDKALLLATPVLGPTGYEVGFSTDCRTRTVPVDAFGVRCIYGYYNDLLTPTPSPTAVPTATNTPVPPPPPPPGGK